MSAPPGPAAVDPGGRRLVRLAAVTALTYLVGYGLVLFAHSGAGWVLVVLGGPLLLATGVLTIRQVQRGGVPPGHRDPVASVPRDARPATTGDATPALPPV